MNFEIIFREQPNKGINHNGIVSMNHFLWFLRLRGNKFIGTNPRKWKMKLPLSSIFVLQILF